MSGVRPSLRTRWESVIFHGRWSGYVQTSKNRGAVSGATFKAVALAWSHHANPDGSDVFPGVATVAVLAEVSFKTAKAVTATLVELGLLVKVADTSRQFRNYDRYRLALPADFPVLMPDREEIKDLAGAMRAAYRARGDQWTP